MIKTIKFFMVLFCGLGVTLAIVACDPETQQEVTVVVENDITTYMVYVMDPRTGLCFARSRTSKSYYVYAPVDCTDKVLNLILNPPR